MCHVRCRSTSDDRGFCVRTFQEDSHYGVAGGEHHTITGNGAAQLGVSKRLGRLRVKQISRLSDRIGDLIVEDFTGARPCQVDIHRDRLEVRALRSKSLRATVFVDALIAGERHGQAGLRTTQRIVEIERTRV